MNITKQDMGFVEQDVNVVMQDITEHGANIKQEINVIQQDMNVTEQEAEQNAEQNAKQNAEQNAEQNAAEQNVNVAEQVAAEHAVTEKDIAEQVAAEHDVTKKDIAEQVAAEHDVTEKDMAEQATAEHDVTKKDIAEQSMDMAEQNVAEIDVVEKNVAEQNAAEKNDAEQIIGEQNAAVDTPKRYSLRVRSTGSSDRKKTPVAARSYSTKSSNAISTKKTRAANVLKARKQDNSKLKLTIKLTLKGKVVAKVVTKKKKVLLKRVKTPKDFFTNQYHFKLLWTPFAEYPKINEKTYQDVYNLLVDSLIPYGISLDRKDTGLMVAGEPQGPMHAGDAVTVDAVVKVIMSQATDNGNALLAQARLVKAFPYTVDGTTVAGKIPNYHDVRTADFTKLADVLAPAGLHKKRAEIVRECLKAIRQKNIDTNSPGCNIDSNPLNATDFVPGSLSLGYLNKLDGQELFDELVSLPGIGVKTACCIMAFNFQLPVFAVDTHVFRMVQWLGWIPDGCNINDAAAHLDKFIPEHLKYGLHQGFWHHGQKCLRCIAKNNPKTRGWEDAVCVIEQFVKRHPKKERKSPSPKRKRGDDNDDDNDGDDTPKRKSRKSRKAREGNRTVPFTAMTEEEAIERGYEVMEIPVNDNFDTKGANITHTRQVWVQNTV